MALSGLEDELDDQFEFETGMREFTPREMEEEEPPVGGGGTIVPAELAARATDIFRKHLGVRETGRAVANPAQVSRLTSTWENTAKLRTTMLIDASCFDRFEAMTN